MKTTIENNNTPREVVIYCLRNLVNGKARVGQTRNGMASRWAGYRYAARRVKCKEYEGLMSRAIRKYGEAAWSASVIDRVVQGAVESLASLQERADARERYHIKRENAIAPGGYNLESGGGVKKTVHPNTIKNIKTGRRAAVSGARVIKGADGINTMGEHYSRSCLCGSCQQKHRMRPRLKCDAGCKCWRCWREAMDSEDTESIPAWAIERTEEVASGSLKRARRRGQCARRGHWLLAKKWVVAHGCKSESARRL